MAHEAEAKAIEVLTAVLAHITAPDEPEAVAAQELAAELIESLKANGLKGSGAVAMGQRGNSMSSDQA